MSAPQVVVHQTIEKKPQQEETKRVDDELRFLHGLSPTWRFVALTSLIFVIWMVHSVATEYIFYGYGADEFPFGFVFTMIQFTIYSLMSASVLKYQGKSITLLESPTTSRIPISWWLIVAALAVASSGLSNQALAFINFPTLLVFKNCKVLFVMTAGFCVFKKTFSKYDLAASTFLVAGLILLSVSNLESISLNITGIALLCVALFADSLLSNFQERLMTAHNVDSNQIMFGSQSIAAFMLLLLSIAYGHLAPGIHFFITHPRSMVMVCVACLIGYIGCYLVLSFMKMYGAFITVTTTSCRKCVSIFLSFVVFPKPLTWRFACAILLVIIGVAINIYSKKDKEKEVEHVQSEPVQKEEETQEKESFVIVVSPCSPSSGRGC